MADNTTTNVNVTRDATSGTAGTNWTVDVTACNLSTDTTIKDFRVLFDGVLQSNADFTKNSAVLITYTGTALTTSTSVTVQRDTPIARVAELTYRSKVSTVNWEAEFNRLHRILNEYDLNGVGSTSIPSFGVPLDEAYSSAWDGDTAATATRNALYDKFELMAPLASPSFTGTAAFGSDVNISGNLDVNGTSQFDGAVTANAASTFNSTSTFVSSATFNGTIDVNSAATFDSTVDFNGACDFETGTLTVPSIAYDHVGKQPLNPEALKNRLLLVARKTAAQNLTLNAFNVITNYLTADLDPQSDFTSSTGIWTVPVTGWYRIFVQYAFLCDYNDLFRWIISFTTTGNTTEAGRMHEDGVPDFNNLLTAVGFTPRGSLSDLRQLTAGQSFGILGYIGATSPGSTVQLTYLRLVAEFITT